MLHAASSHRQAGAAAACCHTGHRPRHQMLLCCRPRHRRRCAATVPQGCRMWPAPSTEERHADAPARDGVTNSRQATAASPREGMPGRQRATGHAATAGAVRSLDAVACGCAATPDPPEWSQAGARPNYRSCSLELGRRRLSSPTSPPQPVALVLVTAQEKKEKNPTLGPPVSLPFPPSSLLCSAPHRTPRRRRPTS